MGPTRCPNSSSGALTRHQAPQLQPARPPAQPFVACRPGGALVVGRPAQQAPCGWAIAEEPPRASTIVAHAIFTDTPAASSSSGSDSTEGRAAGASSTSGSSGASTSGGDWSKRLLSVTKKGRKKKAAEDDEDVFYPEAPAGSSGGDDGASASAPTPGLRSLRRLGISKGLDAPPQQLPPPGFGADFDEDGDGDEFEGSGGSGEKRLPAVMRCFDTARVSVKAGDGGNGCVAFRREKFVEFGGPAGGTGGRGGNVWAVVDPELNSLSCFRQRVHWRAEGGGNGQGSNLTGADAEDLCIPVPAGTIIRRRDAEEGEPPLAELLQAGDKALLAVGGRGGRGNFAFKSSKNKAPTLAEKGEKGAEMWLDFELKVVADVGIIGVPNAGKSTLLSVVTSAKPKIANYPFTTLVPNLGVCELDYRTTVFADVPGLLEGAHEGLGLGHEFLRHVQRCRALVHVVDGSSRDPLGDWRAINLELELFNPDLIDKPQVVAYNKVDLPDSGDYWELMRESLLDEGVAEENLFAVSAATGKGVMELVRRVRALLDELGPQQVALETDAINQKQVPRPSAGRIGRFTIEVEHGPPATYVVRGDSLERFTQMTNWDYYEAVRRFQKVLDVSGVNGALRARGIKEGDTVVIGEVGEFAWQDGKNSDTEIYDKWVADMKDRGVNRQGSARWPVARLEREEGPKRERKFGKR